MAEEKKGYGQTIQLPKGFSLPEDAQEGEEVTVLCKIKPKQDGSAELCSVDGAGYEEKEGPEVVEEEKVEEIPADTEAAQKMDAGSLSDRIKALRVRIAQ